MREMVEVDILMTVRYDPSKVDPADMEWAIDKMGEADVIHNIGYDWDDYSVTSKEVNRGTVMVSNEED